MGIGSGVTVSGVGRYLKSKNLDVQIYGLKPEESNVLNGGKSKEVLMVSSEDVVNMDRERALKEALMVIISSQAML